MTIVTLSCVWIQEGRLISFNDGSVPQTCTPVAEVLGYDSEVISIISSSTAKQPYNLGQNALCLSGPFRLRAL